MFFDLVIVPVLVSVRPGTRKNARTYFVTLSHIRIVRLLHSKSHVADSQVATEERELLDGRTATIGP